MKQSLALYLMTGAAALSLAACGDNAATDTPVADTTATTGAMMDNTAAPATTAETAGMTADAHTTQFLTDAMKGDNSEVRVGKLAAEKGATQGVKDFGTMLVNDHGAHMDKVATLAKSMNVPVTQETKAEADEVYKRLQGLSGAEFDKAFVDAMVKDHKKDIASYQEEAKSSDPAPVTGLAEQTIPTLQKHLDTAEKLQKSS